MVPVCNVVQQPAQNSARERRRRRWAVLICAASRTARVWSGSSEAERPEPGCLRCGGGEMWAESKPDPGRERGIEGSSCHSEKCWFLEEAVQLSSAAPQAAVLSSSISYQSHAGEISCGAMSAYCLLKSVLCNCLLLFRQLSAGKDMLIGLVCVV